MARLRTQLQEAFVTQKFSAEHAKVLAELIYGWFNEQDQKQALPRTLQPNRELSLAEIDKELKTVEVNDDYPRGKLLAPGDKPLTEDTISLLRKEHAAASEMPRSRVALLAGCGCLGRSPPAFRSNSKS